MFRQGEPVREKGATRAGEVSSTHYAPRECVYLVTVRYEGGEYRQYLESQIERVCPPASPERREYRGTNGHTVRSLPGGVLAVDEATLPAGAFVSESRKRLACDGGCGRVFETNLVRFIHYRRRRFCFSCAAAGRVR